MKNKYKINDNFIEIFCKGGNSLIDLEDLSKIENYSWHIDDKGYVRNWKHERLHHKIIGKGENGLMVDHINGDKLDNRKINLRHVSNSKNQLNRHKTSNKLGIIGIIKDKNCKSEIYISSVKWKGKSIYLGRYRDLNKAKSEREEFINKFL